MSGETKGAISGWTVDTLHSSLETQLDDMKGMLNERYATQTKAVDAAFVAQQAAMEKAFTAADKAVQAALDAAKEAVTKAETASEKRFEAVNEFRGQLSDQAQMFLPRAEFTVQHDAVVAQLTALTNRMNRGEGRDSGSRATWDGILPVVSILISMVVAVVLIVHG